MKPMVVESLELPDFAVESRQGPRNAKNEDSYLALPEWNVFAVADGMGGHAGGAKASSTLVEHILQCVSDNAKGRLGETPDEHTLENVIEQANRHIYELSQANTQWRGMGTTLSLLLLRPEEVICFHVGDSRIYEFSNFVCRQLTRDHTPGADDLGQRSLQHTSQRGIQRAVGVKEHVVIDIVRHPRAAGAQYLLVSDGITDAMPDYEIANVLSDVAKSPRKKVQRLLDLAEERQGSDDKTAILVG